METATAEAAAGGGLRSKTIADLLAGRGRSATAPQPRVMYKDDSGTWVDPELRRGRRDRPRPLARADRPRDREGRQGLDPRQHPARVDLLRLRGAQRRRHRRADLPDQLARGVPVRARELRREGGDRRGRRAAREDPRGPRPLPEARARDPDDRHRRRRDLDGGAAPSAAPRARDAEWEERWRSVDPRRHLHLHLHVGDDRPAEGLRDLARQLPRDARHGPSRQSVLGRRASPTSTCRWPTRSRC